MIFYSSLANFRPKQLLAAGQTAKSHHPTIAQTCQLIRAPQRPPFAYPTSVFLAGTTPLAGEPDWRENVVAAVRHLPVVVLDPLRPDWDGTWREDMADPRFREQVEWELDMQERADLVALYYHPKKLAPISLLELGLRARSGKPTVVACPPGYFKRGNVQAVCHRFGIPLFESVDELARAVVEKLGELGVR